LVQAVRYDEVHIFIELIDLFFFVFFRLVLFVV